MTFVASPRIRSVGCVYADRSVYAPRICAGTRWWVSLHGWVRIRAPQGAYTQVGAYTQARGAYKQVGAFTRAAGAHTQRVHICTPGCVRGTRVGASLTARAARVGVGGVPRRPGRDPRTEILTFPDTLTHYSGVIPMVFQKWSLAILWRPPRIGPRVVSLAVYFRCAYTTHPRPRKRRNRRAIMRGFWLLVRH